MKFIFFLWTNDVAKFVQELIVTILLLDTDIVKTGRRIFKVDMHAARNITLLMQTCPAAELD